MIETSDLGGQYIAAQWRLGGGADQMPVVDPNDEGTIAVVPLALPSDVDDAVTTARAALPFWSRTPPAERVDAVRRIADGVEAKAERLTDLIVAELGMPATLTRRIQVDLPVLDFRTTADAAESHVFERRVGNSDIVDVPVGVVAAITPWNYPLHQIAAKVSAALVAGCTVVLKPSEVTPLNALLLAQIVDEVGLPAGVLNVVIGGGDVGGLLVEHPGVDMVSFTGSPEAGSHVAATAGSALKPVALELGGKGASILLDDLDDDGLAKAVRKTVGSCYLNSGQTCSALTRLVVPRGRLDVAEKAAREAAETFVCGNPRVKETRMGPVVSAVQRARVWEYIDSGVADGARLVTGGPGAPEHLPRGYFVRPTVFSDVAPEMRIAQEEIFGPVLVVLGYDDEDDAIDVANGTPYGLTAAVWSASDDRAKEVGRQVRAGQVDLNGGRFNPAAPFGGFGRSGFGREYGREGIAEFLTTRSLQT